MFPTALWHRNGTYDDYIFWFTITVKAGKDSCGSLNHWCKKVEISLTDLREYKV